MRRHVLMRLVVAVLSAGMLLAAVVLPWALGPGLAAGWLSRHSQALPTTAAERPLPGNTRVLAADGSLIAQFYRLDRTPVTSDQIAPVMKQALIDIEDARFYQHGAIDPTGTLRALVTDLRAGSNQQGGSTLTQQLVKQTLVQQATTPAQRRAAVADTLGRKIVEARLAADLAGKFSKDQIL